jgi:putative transcriptional regulator
MISHHPGEEMLVEFAGGSLPAPETLVVSAHLAMCARCRRNVEQLEALGAVLLEDGATAPVEEAAFERLMARIDDGEEATPPPSAPVDAETRATLPTPLHALLPASFPSLRWRRAAPGIEEVALRSYGGARVSLLRIRSGQRVPRHTHGGSEFTLVLTGGYSDGGRHFGAGDIAFADATVDHAPVADDGEPCLCLTVRLGATRLTGPIGRLFNPLIRDAC